MNGLADSLSFSDLSFSDFKPGDFNLTGGGGNSSPLSFLSSVQGGFNIGDLLSGGSTPPITAPTVLIPHPGGGFLSNLDDTINQAADSIANIFDNQAKIEEARARAAVAKASGEVEYQSAQAGLPPPNMLLLGGFALVAILLLNKK